MENNFGKMKLSQAKKVEFDKIVRRVVDVYQPEKIILFGSYPYGEPDADCGLDLLMIKKGLGAVYRSLQHEKG